MLEPGDDVIISTARGEIYGVILYVRMAPPDYSKPLAVCVDVPGRFNSVIFPADKVRKAQSVHKQRHDRSS